MVSLAPSRNLVPRASATAHRPYSVCRVSSHPAACMTLQRVRRSRCHALQPGSAPLLYLLVGNRRGSLYGDDIVDMLDASIGTVELSSRVAWIVSCRRGVV